VATIEHAVVFAVSLSTHLTVKTNRQANRAVPQEQYCHVTAASTLTIIAFMGVDSRDKDETNSSLIAEMTT